MSELEDRIMEVTQTKQKKDRKKKKKQDSLKSLWDNIRYTNIHFTKVQGEERVKRANKLFEGIITGNF